jgi:hypothetical protein
MLTFRFSENKYPTSVRMKSEGAVGSVGLIISKFSDSGSFLAASKQLKSEVSLILRFPDQQGKRMICENQEIIQQQNGSPA